LLRPKTRLNDPSILAHKNIRPLHEVEEAALPYQPAKIADRIASEFLVVKIQPGDLGYAAKDEQGDPMYRYLVAKGDPGISCLVTV